MAKINLSRNIILSLKDYLDPLLDSAGYDFTFVSQWADDEYIVLPADYNSNDAQNQVKLPAGKFTVTNKLPGSFYEIGGNSQERFFTINLFFYAISEGQYLDLSDYLTDWLSDGENSNTIGLNTISLGDYSDVGYPADSAPKLCDMEIQNVQVRPVFRLDSPNVALRFAGSISFTVKIIKNFNVDTE